MNKFLGVIALFVCSSCTITQTVVKPPPNVNMPQEALFISQSGTVSEVLQTLIDLENNEMVVLTYSRDKILNIARTGIYLNPDDYRNRLIQGSDAPLRKNVEPPKEEEKKEKEE